MHRGNIRKQRDFLLKHLVLAAAAAVRVARAAGMMGRMTTGDAGMILGIAGTDEMQPAGTVRGTTGRMPLTGGMIVAVMGGRKNGTRTEIEQASECTEKTTETDPVTGAPTGTRTAGEIAAAAGIRRTGAIMTVHVIAPPRAAITSTMLMRPASAAARIAASAPVTKDEVTAVTTIARVIADSRIRKKARSMD
jgi:hypothetical protein